VQERHDIFVRAHAPHPSNRQGPRRAPTSWPQYALVFDTETTLDPAQKLTFGCFRRYRLIDTGYSCIEEGLFHSDSLGRADRKVLKKYVNNPLNVPATEGFPIQIKLKLTDRARFISHVFWRAVRNGDLVVGFNLPFDLSRLAVKFTNARKDGWSLVLSSRKSRKTGKTEIEPKKPRIVITSLNSKMAFIKLGSIWNREEWPNEARFLDLRTLTWALRNRSYNLESACADFGVMGKLLGHAPTGSVKPREIKYCREDVAATARLLNAAIEEFNRHPIQLNPDKAYSPASIAKAYLGAMNIARPKLQFKVPGKAYGISMQSYYGGRAECRIRKTAVPVVHTDFTSQYPTVNALLGNWNVIKANTIRFENWTASARRLFSNVVLADVFNPLFWKTLSFFVLVKPQKDILPVRTVYNGRTQNIGLNYLTSKAPVWCAAPDVIASVLLTGKVPKIVRAVRMITSGQQKSLQSTNLGGELPIDPRQNDFFVHVIQQRSRFKRLNASLAQFLKVLGNSGSYGLFVQVDTETRSKAVDIRVFSGEKNYKIRSHYVEKSGPWYFPQIASLITAGGRLLLAMLEKCVTNVGGSYLFCDTDSMCMVASNKGGFVPCVGGKYTLHGRPAIKALSIQEVKTIVARFNKLNPYDQSLVRNLLKIEDVNYVDSDPTKSHRQLFGYAIAAKRYALYTQNRRSISIVKASGHGLGYLFAPKVNKSSFDKDIESDDEGSGSWKRGNGCCAKNLDLRRKNQIGSNFLQ
jgi:hypothetical protein